MLEAMCREAGKMEAKMEEADSDNHPPADLVEAALAVKMASVAAAAAMVDSAADPLLVHHSAEEIRLATAAAVADLALDKANLAAADRAASVVDLAEVEAKRALVGDSGMGVPAAVAEAADVDGPATTVSSIKKENNKNYFIFSRQTTKPAAEWQ
jgi:hypothetical protein